MKLKKIFLIALTSLSLISCGNNSNENKKITYGTFAHTESIELKTDELLNKKNKENFLLAVHPEKGSCSCWTTFEAVLNAATKRFNLLSYKILYNNINDELYDNGNGFLRLDDTPTFYIVLNGKIAKRFLYPSSQISDDDLSLFFNEESLYRVIQKYAILPDLYFAKKDKIDEVIKNDALIYFMRSSCSDCSYCTPNILKTYLGNNIHSNKIYVFDLDEYYYLPDDKKSYTEIKDFYNLSSKNKNKFGYSTGFVPTFQKYKNGSLESMAVYFNETIEKNPEGKYVIKESYYSSERIKYLNYKATVLDGTIIPEEYIMEYENTYYIKNNQYHATLYDNILTDFLNVNYK